MIDTFHGVPVDSVDRNESSRSLGHIFVTTWAHLERPFRLCFGSHSDDSRQSVGSS
ncbi:hypothetical protein SMD44_02993 [Streptomyces alboflavus]|uniref:Uncharacterized protein n=2 Tax=Streptomyces alboflavus TaxID=67267 RepID=A0A1Z1WAU1_9ACTN|nr:hypothetical protein SMD44_02993 [Streptomyces alboflavus]